MNNKLMIFLTKHWCGWKLPDYSGFLLIKAKNTLKLWVFFFWCLNNVACFFFLFFCITLYADCSRRDNVHNEWATGSDPNIDRWPRHWCSFSLLNSTSFSHFREVSLSWLTRNRNKNFITFYYLPMSTDRIYSIGQVLRAHALQHNSSDQT
jgi:hypothetical protein